MDTSSSMPSFEIPGMPGANVGMVNIGDILGKSMGHKKGKRRWPWKNPWNFSSTRVRQNDRRRQDCTRSKINRR